MVRRRNLNDAAPAEPAAAAINRRLDAMVAADRAAPARPSGRSFLERIRQFTEGE
jgi:hypothetical protein